MTKEALERANAISKELDALELYEFGFCEVISIQYKKGKYYPYIPVGKEMEAAIERVISDRIKALKAELESL